ncbi:bacteriorhodopsin [Halobacterium rubrum]|uniref:bacteriorhodopsin n=1 Tax=Halobacterium TaxID=2239 RepID=UPI001F011AB0|nr:MULTISPECIES: bacteriorhodopsin [Halobacterium]MDH5019759.1 bacteriorhodopsin [Halobacterium rubrum]
MLELLPTAVEGVSQANITSRPEWIWLALGTVLMGVGTLYFLIKGMGVTDPDAKKFYAITTLIPAIAFTMYLSMLLGYGLTMVPFGGEQHPIYWARYADWLFTTPLLLLDLALLVDADQGTILALVGADGIMIGTGLVGALTKVYEFRFIWWAISTAAMLYILYVLFFGFTAKAEQMRPEVASTFKVLRNVVLVLWSAYPIVWLVGSEGAGIVPLSIETLLFMVLDVSAKVGFGLILLRSRAIFGESEAPEPSAGEGAAATSD